MNSVVFSRSRLCAGAIVLAVWQLTGCVAGQTIALDHEPAETASPDTGIAVQLSVTDQREYVLSGKEPPDYIGQYRAGFGNPWNVTTASKLSFADNLAEDIGEELQNLGFSLAESGADGKLNVDIRDWNFDTYSNGEIWCEIDVSVLAADGSKLASSTVKESREFKGSVWVGAKSAMEEGVPQIYDEVVDAILRSNQAVLDALVNLD